MNEIEKQAAGRDLNTIAGEINTIKDQARSYITNSCIEIGRRLIEAKAMIGHGNWTEWLKGSVDYNERTAQNLMAIARRFGEAGTQTRLIGPELDEEKVKELNYTQMVALLKIRDDGARTEIVNSGEAQALSSRELEAKVKELNEKLEEKTKQAEDLERKAETMRELAEKERGKQSLAKREKEAAEDDAKKVRESMKQMAKEIRELKDRPVETAVVREIPEETKRQMEEDKKRIEDMETELEGLRARAGKEDGEIQFSIAFESVKRDFAAMKEAVDAIRDTEKREKYRNAARKFLELLADDWEE